MIVKYKVSKYFVFFSPSLPSINFVSHTVAAFSCSHRINFKKTLYVGRLLPVFHSHSTLEQGFLIGLIYVVIGCIS